ncbi:hypothetical protein V8C86DRAFT_786217 [Haematococcus lacustris]
MTLTFLLSDFAYCMLLVEAMLDIVSSAHSVPQHGRGALLCNVAMHDTCTCSQYPAVMYCSYQCVTPPHHPRTSRRQTLQLSPIYPASQVARAELLHCLQTLLFTAWPTCTVEQRYKSAIAVPLPSNCFICKGSWLSPLMGLTDSAWCNVDLTSYLMGQGTTRCWWARCKAGRPILPLMQTFLLLECY